MAQIVHSTFDKGFPQTDGRCYIVESHLVDDGRKFIYEYLAEDELDLNSILTNRSATLNAQLVQEAIIAEQINGTILPISNVEFKKRFTTEERIGARALAKTDGIAEDFLDLLDSSLSISMLNPRVMQGLQYLEYRGVLTADRVAVIGAV